VNRREAITLLGGAAFAWPLGARAQQPKIPVIGYIGTGSRESDMNVSPFRLGLRESGFVEGQNFAVEYRYAENQLDRLPELAADLVRRDVSVIVTVASTLAAQAAKAATSTIPIVFDVSNDPVTSGLVASLNQPRGNATGINYFSLALAEKRLGILHEVVPSATVLAVLINPKSPFAAEAIKQVEDGANTLGLKIEFLHATNNREIDAAFVTLPQKRAAALLIVNNTLFTDRRVQIVVLATRCGLPTMYTSRDFVDVGGLMSYGPNLAEADRQVGHYVARILKGEKPADLPVVQPTKFELVINLNTARALDISIPPTLLARADEVIE
jgi:putative tryptophan/tyrosine transport system substrate-binding protein